MRAVVLTTSLLLVPLVGQNSTRKIRPRPSSVAAQAGLMVKWRKDLEAAQAESLKTGKPIFWYVPTLSGSPMDRKVELDRYMMAGPFCWPQLISLLNDAYIPLRLVPQGKSQRAHGLVRGKFIEPGYLVLDKDGKELRRKDRITTFHPRWFSAPLFELVGRSYPKNGAKEVSEAEKQFRKGVDLFHSGQSDRAIKLWKATAKQHPDQLHGIKAAAEAEGHGPFRFGFEVFGDLPPAVLEGETDGSQAPKGAYDEDELRRRSLDFLTRMQLQNGGYEDSRYDFGGTDSLPNVYVACTALVALAMLEELDSRKNDDGDPFVHRLEVALRRAFDYLAEPKSVNLEDRDELVWAHTYRLSLFARLLELRPKEGKMYRALLHQVLDRLLAMQPGHGAWYHEYSNPFVTAQVLTVLSEVERMGVEVDRARVELGLKSLLRCRAPNGGFTYSQVRGRGARVRIEGAAGRMPLCELALLLWGKSEPKTLEAALQVAFAQHHRLEGVRKYDDHADRRYAYGGFFFWFDMLGRTNAIAHLKQGKTRKALLAKQRRLILAIPEIDGCFVDSHELGRTYGTAMALICLARLRE